MNVVSLDTLSAAHFDAALRTNFRIHLESDAPVILELTSVIRQAPAVQQVGAVDQAGMECFALLFTGPANRPLDQRIYRFSHEQLGVFDLFIVPVGVDHGARQYEAIFNRKPRAGLA